MLNFIKQRATRLWQRLENHAAAPAYGGGLLLLLSLSFFGAATNTMAGWLYAMSGLIFALLVWGAILPARSLQSLQVHRAPVKPISVGDELLLELTVTNPSRQPKQLLQVTENIPAAFGLPQWLSIETIAPGSGYQCRSFYTAERRGIYHWSVVWLRTGAPLGLFWSQRSRLAPVRVVVYPEIIPLRRCQLIDTLAREQTVQLQRDRVYHNATEGMTRALRPYRVGDPTRLIHWRTSARFDQLQVRELEVLTSGQEVVIALDSGSLWEPERFEQAVTVAASLYFYASRQQMAVQLWTATTGLVQGNHVVLETLAGVNIAPETAYPLPFNRPIILLTSTPKSLAQLNEHSHFLWFSDVAIAKAKATGKPIERDRPLVTQLARI